MNILTAVLTLLLAAPAATPRWTAVYSGEYGLNVPPGAAREMTFQVPPRFATQDRPVTFSWSVIRPSPLPTLIVLEQCSQPDVCYGSVFRPTGQGNGTTRTKLRVTNRSIKPVDVLFRYTVWEAR
jgi:hypothetical protein